MSKTVVEIEGKELKLTNLDKVLYPKAQFTKAEVIDYYRQIAPYILPHLQDHALTLKRYPDGVEDDFFYEKRCPPYRPDWVQTIKSGKSKIKFCQVTELPTLVWIANLASLELHTMLSKEKPEIPSLMVFDLDPGAPAGIMDCIPIALEMRELLNERGLKSFMKTSGGKGLHLYVPLNNDNHTFDDTKAYSKAIAQLFESEYPDKVTSNMKKDQRENKIFIDWSQNDMNKTTVCVYSLRARDYPTVSTPVKWEELEIAQKKNDPELLVFKADDVLKRVKKHGDLWEEVLNLKQVLR